MKILRPFLFFAVALLATSASAQITFFEPTDDDPEPTENVVFDAINESGQSVGTFINASQDSNFGARGAAFVMGAPGNPVEIGGATFQAGGAQTFAPGDEITVAIFAGNDITGADLTDISPTGLTAAAGVSAILYEETFALPENVPAENFLIINFASSFTVDSGDELGIMVFTNVDFQQLEGSNNGGGRLLYRASGTGGPSGARDFRYSILAPAPPTGGGDIPPSMFTTFRGNLISASLNDFIESDDVSAMYNPGFVLNDTEAPVWLIFDGNGAGATGFQVESNAGTPGLEYTVEAFNFGSNAFEVVGTQLESFNMDQVQQFAITPADHVDANGDVRSRVGWRQVGFIINFPWVVNVDQVFWTQ